MASTFGERLLEKRKAAGLSRAKLAAQCSITEKSIQNYEIGDRYPHNTDIVKRLADALNTTVIYLMGEEGKYIQDAREKGGPRTAAEVREIVEDLAAIFAGGQLPEEDRDAMMAALNKAYWLSKLEDEAAKTQK